MLLLLLGVAALPLPASALVLWRVRANAASASAAKGATETLPTPPSASTPTTPPGYFDWPMSALTPPMGPNDFGDPTATGAAIAQGSKLLAGILAATPAAPLSPFVGVVGAVLGGLAVEHDKAEVAQPRLSQAGTYALAQSRYEAYTAQYQAARAAWDAGLYPRAQELLAGALAAGDAAALDVAAKLDALEVGSYRAWMAKGPSLLQSQGGHLYEGWQLGDGGFTGRPADAPVDDGTWYYSSRATSQTLRYHWDPSNPDYGGTVVPGLSPEAAARAEAARSAQRDAQVVAVSDRDVASTVNDNKFGSGVARYNPNASDILEPEDGGRRPPSSKPTPPAAPAPAPAPTPAPAPVPPLPPAPPTPPPPPSASQRAGAARKLGDVVDPW